MSKVTFFKGEQFPLEMHKVRIIQKLNLLPIEERLQAMNDAGCNTFLLQNRDVFLDMLTDSGVNAMSDQQQAAMLIADGAWNVQKMVNVEELPPRPFLALLNRMGLPTRIRDGQGDRAVHFPPG